MTTSSVLGLVLLGLLTAFTGLCTIRAAARAFGRWRVQRRLPIVTASDKELAEMPREWVLPAPRWPNPNLESMSSLRLRALARAARSRRRLNMYVSEMLGLIGSAALGVQLPGLFATIARFAQTKKPAHPSSDLWSTLSSTADGFGHGLAVVLAGSALILIAIVVALRGRVVQYEDAERAYLHFARQTERAAQAQPTRLLARLRRAWAPKD